MKLFKNEDLLKLSVDEDPLINSSFGKLTVLGTMKDGYTKYYIVECSVCKQDPELFGDGLFSTTKSHLHSGKLPCGCSKVPKWNPDQQQTRMMRVLTDRNYSLLHADSYTGQDTKILVKCPEHGVYESTFSYIINGRGCRQCADEVNSKLKTKPDEVMIASFFSTNKFHPETVFTRSGLLTSQGAKNYWNVYCPVCKTTAVRTSSDLRRGFVPCACAKDFKFSYIHLIQENDTDIAIKFGITSDHKERLYRQNLKAASGVKIVPIGVWEFPSNSSCRDAEKACKKSFVTCVVDKGLLSDGYTETTSLNNIESIITIYEDFGGIRLMG